ncbi:DUF3293 domain-containing protein [Cupriavidus pinatubonensis]|uniref:DUF3293 domain-containing protein n=1 Tax=Cupriavidus pinatubonensis TaxID=248026 RepID=UPI001129F1B0|nr:DUF3293 domain-containing protein [Cupriavidus pinatubonensis]TPQ30929.1 DUF3293 domain-containing protein [Cupriavidus pinatubonensis]
MFSGSEIPREIIQAYLETYYHVHGSAPTTLKVGEANPVLAALHETADVGCSAFITAWNPYSERQELARNLERQQALVHTLLQCGFHFIDGIGQHPANGWPAEESFLTLGLALDDAKALGTQFGQNAIVWSGSDAVPQLILLR